MIGSSPCPFAGAQAPAVHPLGSTASLLNEFRVQARHAGLPPATVMIQGFMEALALAGSRLSWKRSKGGAPSFARVSMTATGREPKDPKAASCGPSRTWAIEPRGFWMGDYGGRGPGSLPFWRTLIGPVRDLTPVPKK